MPWGSSILSARNAEFLSPFSRPGAFRSMLYCGLGTPRSNPGRTRICDKLLPGNRRRRNAGENAGGGSPIAVRSFVRSFPPLPLLQSQIGGNPGHPQVLSHHRFPLSGCRRGGSAAGISPDELELAEREAGRRATSPASLSPVRNICKTLPDYFANTPL